MNEFLYYFPDIVWNLIGIISSVLTIALFFIPSKSTINDSGNRMKQKNTPKFIIIIIAIIFCFLYGFCTNIKHNLVEMPKVTPNTYNNVIQALDNLNIIYETDREVSDYVNTIVGGQSIPANTIININQDSVILYIDNNTGDEMLTVPDLSGFTKNEAIQLSEEDGNQDEQIGYTPVISQWNETELTDILFITENCYSLEQPFADASQMKRYQTGDSVYVIALTDTYFYKLAEGGFIYRDYLSQINTINNYINDQEETSQTDEWWKNIDSIDSKENISLFVDLNEVILLSEDSVYITITAKGSHVLKATSQNKNIADISWIRPWDGDDIRIKVTGKNTGTTTITVQLSKYPEVFQTINVTVMDE